MDDERTTTAGCVVRHCRARIHRVQITQSAEEKTLLLGALPAKGPEGTLPCRPNRLR